MGGGRSHRRHQEARKTSDVANSRERRGGAGPPLPEVSSVRNGSGDSYSESSVGGGEGGKHTDCKCGGGDRGHVTTRREQRKRDTHWSVGRRF